MGVVVVPAKIRDPKGLLVEAEKAKMNGIELFAIGIGSTDSKLLNRIASSPKHVIHVKSAAQLASYYSEFVQKLCEKPSKLLDLPPPDLQPKKKTCYKTENHA